MATNAERWPLIYRNDSPYRSSGSSVVRKVRDEEVIMIFRWMAAPRDSCHDRRVGLSYDECRALGFSFHDLSSKVSPINKKIAKMRDLISRIEEEIAHNEELVMLIDFKETS